MKPETSFILYLYPPSRLLQERVASLARLGYDKGLGEKSQLKTECLQVSCNTTSCHGKYPPLLQINDDADCIRYTQNHDVSTLVGDGTSASVGQLSSSWGAPLVSAVMVSIILNLVNFSIIYYQVSPGHSLAATTINLLSMPCACHTIFQFRSVKSNSNNHLDWQMESR